MSYWIVHCTFTLLTFTFNVLKRDVIIPHWSPETTRIKNQNKQIKDNWNCFRTCNFLETT